MLLFNQPRKHEDAIENIYIYVAQSCMDVTPGRLEKRRERDWRLSKCGATEE